MHVTVLVINESAVLIHPIFFKTIISTLISPGELLLMANKSVDSIKFLSGNDTKCGPPGCSAGLLLIGARLACFFHELRKGTVAFIEVRVMEVYPCRVIHGESWVKCFIYIFSLNP